MLDYIIDFLVFMLIYFIFFYRNWVKKSTEQLILNTIMYSYIILVISVTLMPFSVPLYNGTNNLFWETANFVPFRDLRLNYYGATREIILNIIMLIPFGFLFPLIKKAGSIKTIFVAFLFSLTIETTQLVGTYLGGLNSRSFDVTDLITNTFGGFIGYLLFIIARLTIKRIFK